MSFDLDDDETLISISRTDRYEGEDTSPTTDRELKAWYAYPIAAEVFAVVAVTPDTRKCRPEGRRRRL
ncbi:hypothetical protein IG631_03385 [Alternaria alternata]|nr:hypothetical protein IG631_03385 [Alternaria alternata]